MPAEVLSRGRVGRRLEEGIWITSPEPSRSGVGGVDGNKSLYYRELKKMGVVGYGATSPGGVADLGRSGLWEIIRLGAAKNLDEGRVDITVVSFKRPKSWAREDFLIAGREVAIRRF